ncbi:hypothetical protein HDU81_000333, partial [Chytriomyces hyalinus]
DSLALINGWIITTTHITRNCLEYDKRLCQIHAVLTVAGCLIPVSVCSGLTFLRYKMIVKSQKVTTKFVVAYISIVTFASFIAAGSPFLLGSQDASYLMQPSGDDCTPRWYGRDPPTLVIILTCFVVLGVPLVGMGCAYYKIYRKVSTTFEAFKGASTYSYESSLQSLPDRKSVLKTSESRKLAKFALPRPKETKSEEEEKQMKLLIQSLAIVGVFEVGWAPYFMFEITEIFSGVPQATEFEFAADFVMQLNFAANPIVIFVFDEEIRNNVFGTKKEEHPKLEEVNVGTTNGAVTLQ